MRQFDYEKLANSIMISRGSLLQSCEVYCLVLHEASQQAVVASSHHETEYDFVRTGDARRNIRNCVIELFADRNRLLDRVVSCTLESLPPQNPSVNLRQSPLHRAPRPSRHQWPR